MSPSMLPEELQESPQAGPSDEMQVEVPEIKLPPPAKSVPSAPVPEGPTERTGNGLLSNVAGIDFDEQFSKDEQLLNEFVKLHPMLSLQATSATTLQLMSGMLEKAHIKVPELEMVSKSHDDRFLSPPDASIGERECVCGDRCLANFVAKIRYGKENTKGFVCKEFLLPSQYDAFLKGEGLPQLRQKCLLCQRYWTSYVYLLARTDSNFKVPSGTQVQTFANVVGDTPEHGEIVSAAAEMPTHSSALMCKDGYRQDAMLFVDEGFSHATAQRNSKLSALSFKPVVRFSSSHYRYVKGPRGENRIVQVGVGVDEHLDGLSFQQPPAGEANPAAAMTHQAGA